MSSLCGSADVLEALGVAVEVGPEGVARCIEEAGVGFMFAPTYHPAMKASDREAGGLGGGFGWVGGDGGGGDGWVVWVGGWVRGGGRGVGCAS